MTHKEFIGRITRELTLKEYIQINSKIYFNSEYIDYYMAYENAEYDYCYGFLIQNRHLLQDELTPQLQEIYDRFKND